jgi:DNA-binding MarR family transcriptional regulator
MAGDEAGVAAWARLLQVHAALVPTLDREVQLATGLPLAWYDVLLELNSAPDRRLRMTDLGDRVVLSRTRVSRIVDELVEHGLVGRNDNPADRRSAFALITPEGRRRLRAAAPVYLGGIGKHFAEHLTQSEAIALRTALEKVLDAHQGKGALPSLWLKARPHAERQGRASGGRQEQPLNA